MVLLENLSKTNLIVLEMLNMQEKLDELMYSSNGTKYNSEHARLALFDELGEFNHERKKAWCWWKKTQKDIDIDKMFEELIDCWHFALSIYNHEYRNRYLCNPMVLKNYKQYWEDMDYSSLQIRIAKGDLGVLEAMCILSDKAGFTIEEVLEEYKRKNQINVERMRAGY